MKTLLGLIAFIYKSVFNILIVSQEINAIHVCLQILLKIIVSFDFILR